MNWLTKLSSNWAPSQDKCIKVYVYTFIYCYDFFRLPHRARAKPFQNGERGDYVLQDFCGWGGGSEGEQV